MGSRITTTKPVITAGVISVPLNCRVLSSVVDGTHSSTKVEKAKQKNNLTQLEIDNEARHEKGNRYNKYVKLL